MKHTFLSLILSFSVLPIFSANEIALNTLGSQPDFTVGISWGAPFAAGEVKAGDNFVLLNENNAQIPLQTWTLAYHPDGSVKWMGFAAAVNPQEKFILATTDISFNTSRLKIADNKDFIQINNGNFVCQINKHGSEIIRSISIDNKTVSENGVLRASLEHRKGKSVSYEDYLSEIKQVTVEQQGDVRAVIKVEGKYKSQENGREFLPFALRLYFYQNVDNLRIVHSFVYDGEQSEDFIKSLGITFDVPLREQPHNRHIRFAGEDGGLWSEAVTPLVTRGGISAGGERNLPARQSSGEKLPDFTAAEPQSFTTFNHLPRWNDYKLTQLVANGFTIKKRTNNQSSWLFANEGGRAAGLVLAGDASGGVAVAMKDFWQSFPASLQVTNAATERAQVAVWFWSPDGEAMDLRHYDTIAHDLDATYEDVQAGLSTPYGIARTSEITVFPFVKLPSRQTTVAMAEYSSHPSLLVCTPEYLHSKRAFGVWSLPNKITHPTAQWIETQLDSAFIFYQRAVDEHSWYGFWNFGDVMHSYDPSRHVWRYDIGGYAWDNTELAPGNWLWYSFLRSGREDIFRMAEAMTRHNGEVDTYHLGEMKGLGSRHNVSHWGDGAKEARIGQAAWKRYYYYLTTDERSGDLMREALDVEKALMIYEPLRVAQPREKFPYNAPARLRWGPDWLALAGNWFTEWERTGNAAYRDKILAGMKSLIKLPNNLFTGPNGLGYDPATSTFSYDGDKKTTNKNHLATIMGGYEILLEIFENIDYKPFKKQFTEYAKFYSMPADDPARTTKTQNWGNIGFRNPRLAAFAAKELNDKKLAARAWSEFLFTRPGTNRALPNLYGSQIIAAPEVLRPIHENPSISTNSTAQWGINAIIMLELIGEELP
ncbi:MAG: hypothetical protein LBN23_00330 [Paludibacter sp.]|jgi:hypothetical protein|nr:hypothetical protein [Paludibacter sp.]